MMRPVTLAAVSMLICASINCATAQAAFRAAYGKTDITPDRPVFMAGYAINRKSIDAHDRLFGRCLVVENNGVRIALVSCDLIGLPRFEVLKIRSMVHSVPADHVIIGATHTHSGPDTLGMWGPAITASGVDQEWLDSTRRKLAALVDSVAGRLSPAAVRFASTTQVGRISKNIRIPGILDTELGVMQIVPENGGQPIVTLVNYACHPEILDNRHITADFPNWLYQAVTAAGGGECIYFNGAQGGMITADYDESSAPKGENWKAAETIGTSLGSRSIAILSGVEPIKNPSVGFERRVFDVPLENMRYKTLIALKVFSGQPRPDGTLETEVCRVTIGPAEFLTLPGEVLPNVGIYLKGMMKGKPRFLLGLTDDFLGYILTPEDFGLPLYTYESGQSVGPHIEPLMVQSLIALMHSGAGEPRAPSN